MFLAIRSVQNVQNNRTNIFGLKISRNTAYGVNSYLSIMISERIPVEQKRFLWNKHVFPENPHNIFLKWTLGNPFCPKGGN